MLSLARKLVSFLDRQSRIRMALLLLPMLAMALLEMASVGLILPVIQVLLLGETDGAWTRMLLEFLPAMKPEEIATWVAGIFAGLFILKNVLLFFMVYLINRVVNLETAKFKARMFEIYLSRPLAFHFQNNSAVILRNLTTGVSLSFEAVRQVLLMALEALLMVAAFILLLLVEPGVTLVMAAVLGSVGLLFYKVASPVFRRWGERALEYEGQLLKWINQSLASIRDVKLLHAYGFLYNKVKMTSRNMAIVASISTSAIQIPRLMIETVIVIGFLVVVLILLSVRDSSSDVVAILGLYGMAALRLMPSINRILSGATELRHRTAYIEVLHKDMTENSDGIDRESGKNDAAALSLEKELHLDNVTYTYPDAAHHAVRGVSLTVQKGESIGFVGPSGAGKTTLLDIMLGLLQPQSGSLRVDGQNISENLGGWQRHIGYVPQNITLIDDTLRRNIAFAVEDDAIDENRLEEVVRLSRLDSVVARLPEGLDTMIGERGTRLSGGQRQRIAIARALYRDPDVLVFDEATAALDNETEREITAAIESLSGEKTILIIAHRLSTVRNCGRLVLMRDGRIDGVGSFERLIADNEEFRNLAALSNLNGASGAETAVEG